MRVEDFLGKEVMYESESQQLFAIDEKGGMQLIADLRGWGGIQNLFNLDLPKAAIFQDELGQWIADAINNKLKKH